MKASKLGAISYEIRNRLIWPYVVDMVIQKVIGRHIVRIVFSQILKHIKHLINVASNYVGLVIAEGGFKQSDKLCMIYFGQLLYSFGWN